MTARPVTQTDEVEVKRAFTKRRLPLGAEKGNHRRIPPIRITAAKLRTKILLGERDLEKKFLILRRTFIALGTLRNRLYSKNTPMSITQRENPLLL